MPCLLHRLRHGAMKGYPTVLDGDKVDTKEATKMVAYSYQLRCIAVKDSYTIEFVACLS